VRRAAHTSYSAIWLIYTVRNSYTVRGAYVWGVPHIRHTAQYTEGNSRGWKRTYTVRDSYTQIVTHIQFVAHMCEAWRIFEPGMLHMYEYERVMHTCRLTRIPARAVGPMVLGYGFYLDPPGALCYVWGPPPPLARCRSLCMGLCVCVCLWYMVKSSRVFRSCGVLIYIFRERDREREKERCVWLYVRMIWSVCPGSNQYFWWCMVLIYICICSISMYVYLNTYTYIYI